MPAAELAIQHRLDSAIALAERGEFFNASVFFDSVLNIDPSNINALVNGAFCKLKSGMKDEAYRLITKAMATCPEDFRIWGIAALIYKERGNYSMAETAFQTSIIRNPNDATTRVNYAYFLLWIRGEFRKAMDMYTSARDINPLNLQTRFDRSMCLLTCAANDYELKEALSEYEIRLMLTEPMYKPFSAPMYTGEGTQSTVRKTILLVAEQGLGDTVMMSRYFSVMEEDYFSKAIMLCQKPVADFLNTIPRYRGKVFSDQKKLPHYDYYIPMMSIMRVVGMPTKPARSYLSAEIIPLPPVKQDGPVYRVGVCWKGNPSHGNDRFRSIDVSAFTSAFEGLEGVQFFSLMRPEEELAGMPPYAVSGSLVKDVTSLAGLISSMDLVITVDTLQLHLSGALGIPTIALIANCPDWRWGMNISKTRWYDSVNLMRSKEPLRWAETLNAARNELITRREAYLRGEE